MKQTITTLNAGYQRAKPQKARHILHKTFWAAMMGLVLVASCKKDDKGIVTPPDPPKPFPTAEHVTASFQGNVVDETGKPVSGAKVLVGATTVNTDATGYFKVTDARVDKHAAFIQVEKEGYFPGSRTMMVTAGTSSEARIKLIERKKAGEFPQANGGTVAVPDNGGSVVFPANAVINPATNQLYTGTVEVAARYLNPALPSITEIMPGELRAIDSNGTERGLQSFAMMAVELTGSNGEKLQLGNGKTATLTFPIPAELQAQAPANIPLWYFDEVKGLWKEEGWAKKEGNNYVGTVKHFSFWNCDLPYAPTDFEASFKDEAGNPMPGLRITVRSNEAGDVSVFGYDYSDKDGKITAKIPAGKSLKMIVQNQVGTELYAQTFTSTTAATNLGAIVINTASLPRVRLTGSVKDCAGKPVINGFVAIKLDGQTYKADLVDGNFNISVVRANTTAAQAMIIGYNLADSKASDPGLITVTTGNASAVSLVVCADPAEFVRVEINGQNVFFNDIKDVFTIRATGGITQILVMPIDYVDKGQTFSLAIQGINPGEYNLTWLTCTIDPVGTDYYQTNPDVPYSKVVITKLYEKDGVRYQEGTFENAPLIFTNDASSATAKGSYKVRIND